MHRCPGHITRATTLVVSAWLCLGVAGIAQAKGSKAEAKLCKAEAKVAKKTCDGQKKASVKACKALVKTHKAECKARKKECKAELRDIKQSEGKNAAKAKLKCEVLDKICKVEAKADVKRCEQMAKREHVECTLRTKARLDTCLAKLDFDTETINGQCRAECKASFKTSVPRCKAHKKFRRSTCELENKLQEKDCKARKSLCVEENRVLRVLQLTGGEVPEFARKQGCKTRLKGCKEGAKEDLKLCRRRVKNTECEPPNISSCIRSCVKSAEAKAQALALALEDERMRKAEAAARKKAEDAAAQALKDKLAKMPSAKRCREHATVVYTDLLKAVIDGIYPHKDNASKAFTTFEKVLSKRRADNKCVLESMKLWEKLPKPLNIMMQDYLPDPEAEFERRLGPSGIALINDAMFHSLLGYTFTKYHRHRRR